MCVRARVHTIARACILFFCTLTHRARARTGEVVATGPDVTIWHEGDYVCSFLPGGGYAEFCIAEATQCWPIPKGLGWEVAAALPVCLCTSWNCLFEMGELKRGQTVLIHGGAGGVGHMMIQIARQFGIEVITTSSSRERAAFCKSLGSGIAVVRSEQNFVDVVKESTAGRGVDVVVDCIGGPTANANLQALRIGGRYIMMASDTGSGHVDLQKVIDKRLTITGSSLRSREPAFRNALAAVVKENLWDMLENKVIAPRIEKVFKMSEAAKAIKLIEQGEVMGKVVCTVGGELLRADL